MKYKIGDKVRVKSKEWYDEYKGENGTVPIRFSFIEKMSNWCGKEVTIDAIYDDTYKIKEDENLYTWTDTMFEDEIVKQPGQRKFKCKDEVIVRYNKPGRCWFYGVVSNSNDEGVVLSGGFRHPYEVCDVLPFAGNEHLVGTTDEPEEEVVVYEGEYIIVSDRLERLAQGFGTIRKFTKISEEFIFTTQEYWKYFIPFSKFNPDDLEATKKEILMVKNGKLVKAW